MEKKCKKIGVINDEGYERDNRVYKGGLCPTLISRDYKEPVKVVKRWAGSHKERL